MSPRDHVLAEALALPLDEREELAGALLDSLEPPHGILTMGDRDEIRARAEEARTGEPGAPWAEVRAGLTK